MAFSMIYSKTTRGSAEIKARSNALPPVARRVLIMIDGKRSEAELAQVVREGELDAILATLRSLGMVEEVGLADLPEPMWDDDDETVLIEPPTVRIDLGGSFAAAAPPPPTLHAEVAPAIAAAARPITPSVGTAPARMTASIGSLAAAAAPAAAHAMMNAAATAVAAPMAQAPARVPPPAAAPARTPILARVFAPDKSAAPAAPPPAEPVPAALEDSKRLAVRALYERLGPYGEVPAARIQDCKTVDALHEQVKFACQRITTFRGEGAAREYLAAIGMA